MASFAVFDEDFYLENNPDVAAAVSSGGFSSGLEHFQQFGLQEGRTLVSYYYNEETYLDEYPDVAAAVGSGAFSSGLEHYIQFGEAEGRSGIPFDEGSYLTLNPDVEAAVNAGAFSSGLDHYQQHGQFEESRGGYFGGTTGNDVVTGFGESTSIHGINFETTELSEEGNRAGISRSSGGGDVDTLTSKPGTGEVDTLIGNTGEDVFELGFIKGFPSNFYVGEGNADYALIKDFDQGTDFIRLGGSFVSLYNIEAVNGNLNISNLSGDLIGVVEGVTSLSEVQDTSSGSLLLG